MKILPYPQIPQLICYQNKAFPIGIIQANSPENITKWLCTKSINTVYNPKSPQNKFDLAMWDTWGNWEGITTQQIFSIKKELISLMNVDLLDMFRIFLDNECYIQGTYNEKHIPSKSAYEKENYNHDFLVIGYDDNNFYSVGFVADSRFKHFIIPNQKFIDAVTDIGGSKVAVNFFSYNREMIPKPNIDRMLSDLEKYISTANYMDRPTFDAISYGISTLMRVKDFFVEEVITNKKIYVDKRYSRVLYEHEWILSQVIEIFLDSAERTEFIKCANENLDCAKLVHRLGLKMELNKKVDSIYSVANLIDRIVENEKKYIPQLISLLRMKHEKNLI